uniref:Uncharacterized protein n=1 Tax=Plectus sambesii TaxID=2011161 RepID=A0A914WGQ8_9BILA
MSDEMPTIPRTAKARQAGCLCGLCDSSDQSCAPYCLMDRSNVYEHPTLINNNKDDLRKSLDLESEHDELVIVEHLKDFSQETTAHGISRIGSSKTCCGRLAWGFGVVICFVLFTTQAFWVIEKFQRNEKIVNVEMKFDPSQFPAITVCNLNPYKKSLARQVTDIRET